MVYVAFKIGRGGRFYNPGHLSFYGEMTFFELVSEQSNYLFIKDRDEHGRFCKKVLIDGSGNIVSEDDINGKTGRLDYDGAYNTYYVREMHDLNESERNAIREDRGYISDELREYLEAHNEEDGIYEEDDDEE